MEWSQHLIVLSSTAFSGMEHSVFDGQLAARNFERDYGAVEKEIYIEEIISFE